MKPVLVLGGTAGKTGRRVAQRLEARGVPVRNGSRSGNPSFDWEDPSTWKQALHGVGAVYLVYYPDLAMEGADVAVSGFVEEAVKSGVSRIVLLSGRGEEGAGRGENIVKNSGIEWTILRSSWFAQNFSEGHLLEPVLEGTVALPAGDVAEPFIDADDIANVAVAAFTDRRHVGQLYELTGPRLLTFADAVAEIGAAAGRKLNYVPISAAEYESMLAQYAPPEFANWLSALFTEVLDGRNAHLNDGVQRALGRPPRDFADYARAAAATGVWNATAR
jgi:uncharacterized protein YbjT (DUF2867 family)